jgi:hypothetical protein
MTDVIVHPFRDDKVTRLIHHDDVKVLVRDFHRVLFPFHLPRVRTQLFSPLEDIATGTTWEQREPCTRQLALPAP